MARALGAATLVQETGVARGPDSPLDSPSPRLLDSKRHACLSPRARAGPAGRPVQRRASGGTDTCRVRISSGHNSTPRHRVPVSGPGPGEVQ